MMEPISFRPIAGPIPSSSWNDGRVDSRTAQLRLAEGAVHVWTWDLDVLPTTRCWEILNEEETVRARRFVFPRDRDRFVRAHAILRTLLCGYVGIAAGELVFSSSQYGKPQIKQSQTLHDIRFNLSHSAGVAVLAVARRCELGIDVEALRPIEPEIAEGHFSPHELRTLQSLPAEEWLQGFYRCWTSKEALLKGEGLGLNLPLDSFDVEADPHRPPKLLGCRPPATIAPGWNFVALNPAPNTVCTLVVRNETPRSADRRSTQGAIQCFAFNG